MTAGGFRPLTGIKVSELRVSDHWNFEDRFPSPHGD